jgi:hypothetical protein
MNDSDGQLNGQLKPIPVAEFEGEFVRFFESKLPALSLDMAVGYPRGTHIVLEVETRVRNVSYIEDKNGDLIRMHVLTLEEVREKEAFDPANRPTNVGGNSAGDAWVPELLGFLKGEHDVLNFDGEDVPERLQEMLKVYAEHTARQSDLEVGF